MPERERCLRGPMVFGSVGTAVTGSLLVTQPGTVEATYSVTELGTPSSLQLKLQIQRSADNVMFFDEGPAVLVTEVGVATSAFAAEAGTFARVRAELAFAPGGRPPASASVFIGMKELLPPLSDPPPPVPELQGTLSFADVGTLHSGSFPVDGAGDVSATYVVLHYDRDEASEPLFTIQLEQSADNISFEHLGSPTEVIEAGVLHAALPPGGARWVRLRADLSQEGKTPNTAIVQAVVYQRASVRDPAEASGMISLSLPAMIRSGGLPLQIPPALRVSP